MDISKYLVTEATKSAMNQWRTWLKKNRGSGYIENDVILDDLGMGTKRYTMRDNNVDPKWFAKTFLKGIKHKIKNNLIFVDSK